MRGDVAEIQRVLQNPDTDANSKDGCGYPALMWAAREGFKDIVEQLLLAGVD